MRRLRPMGAEGSGRRRRQGEVCTQCEKPRVRERRALPHFVVSAAVVLVGSGLLPSRLKIRFFPLVEKSGFIMLVQKPTKSCRSTRKNRDQRPPLLPHGVHSAP